MPKVSIITPVLNAERFLLAAIASVLAQTETDWELLLIDDGSTDASPAIAAAAATGDARIRTVSRPANARHGAAAARNAGLAQARGEFVAFLDADDLYEPQKLATELALLDAHPEAAMVYGPTLWWRDGERPWRWVEPMQRQANRLHRPPALVSKVILSLDWHVPCTCAVLIRRSAIAETGGFEEQFTLYEDQTLWTKLFLRYPVFIHDRCLSRYRQHEHSVSAEASKSGQYQRHAEHRSRAAFLDWVAQYLGGKTALRRALRLARAPYAPPGLQRSADLAYLRAKRATRRVERSIRRWRQ
ncbi:Glycosyl transferase family protein [Devosia sp. LC5]|uniref:glycosyltransferase n=1 Tax=Devosia sp. LC5 TaxID=1502724 RepID=UPI0004E34562|nr:glycosyltransferase [Devosia sp. LC5]KFC67374.1 Glycosyl transferase family protein [Devosia sp. LC5]